MRSKADLKSTKRWCVSIYFYCVFSKTWRKDLVYDWFARSETALIRTNQFVDEWFQPFTLNAWQDSICNREQTYATIIATDCGITFFKYWAEQTQTPFTWHAFQWPYVSEKLVHTASQPISFGFKKFSRTAIKTAGFVEFKLLNGHGHFFPVWWCNWGSIVQSVWKKPNVVVLYL